MPDPIRLLKTLERATVCFRNTPGRKGRIVEIPSGTDLLVAGDLHGNVEHFRTLLTRADLKHHPGRHAVFQEVVHGSNRYPTGGDRSHQVLDLIAALKCQYPERVHLLPGNHELAQFTGELIAKGDEDLSELFREGVHTAYAPHGDQILAAYGELFFQLPFAVRTPNRVFLSHSVPTAVQCQHFTLDYLYEDVLLEQEARWAPIRKALHALVWGRDTRESTIVTFLGLVDADFLITGHIPCDEGYAVPNSRQLILDCHGIPGGYCLFPLDCPLTQADLLAGVQLL